MSSEMNLTKNINYLEYNFTRINEIKSSNEIKQF